MIKSVLPEGGGQGGQWRDHRQVINGILWQARTGAPWRDVPDRYRPWKTLHERLRRRTADGTWEAIFQHVKGNVQLAEDDDAAELWEVSVDSTVTRAHQHAAGARKKRGICRHRRLGCDGGGRRRGGAGPLPGWPDQQAARGAGRPFVGETRHHLGMIRAGDVGLRRHHFSRPMGGQVFRCLVA